MVLGLFARRPSNQPSMDRLHGEIMAAARQPALYLEYGVEDSFDGRFEALALLATIPLRRLARLPPPGPEFAQTLTDTFFRHMDDALRALGVSDVGVPKRMQKLAANWLGRRQAYVAALDETDDTQLAAAIARNVYVGRLEPPAACVQRLARYARAVEAAQAGAGVEMFLKGPAVFPDPIQII